MKKFLSIIFFALIIILSVGLFLRHTPVQPTDSENIRTIIVKARPITSTSFFSGTIQPSKIINVPSPDEGEVTKINYIYGHHVNKDDILLVINSKKFEESFQSTLSEYLKARNSYKNSKIKIQGVEELWKDKLISRNEYMSETTQHKDAYLSYRQSEHKFEQLLKKSGVKNTSQYLKTKEVEAIEKALSEEIGKLEVIAPANGIALVPDKETTADADIAKHLVEGSHVKDGQVLISIGDMSSFAVEIRVNEIHVEELKPGQKVIVTGVAFSDLELHGKITNIDAQASSERGGIPSFPVRVVVPDLTKQQQKLIHVGMSAKVKITISQASKIKVPISAVKQSNGISTVKIIDKKTKKIKEVRVKTGSTTQDSVIIESGLNPGDEVVIDH